MIDAKRYTGPSRALAQAVNDLTDRVEKLENGADSDPEGEASDVTPLHDGDGSEEEGDGADSDPEGDPEGEGDGRGPLG